MRMMAAVVIVFALFHGTRKRSFVPRARAA